MNLLRALEAKLVRIEGAVAVALVLVMLVLAGYNVFYRNVLVPLQKHWAHSGPPVVAQERTPVAATKSDAKTPTKVDAPSKSAAEGFGGDWGEGDDGELEEEAPQPARVEEKAPPKKEPAAAEGFGGDWGEGDDGDVE